MKYMINIDLETRNLSEGRPNCPSALHEKCGRHYDLTVHVLGCGSRNSRAVHRPPSRYWDDKDGEGYTFKEAVERLQGIVRNRPDVHLRRCSKCGVEAYLPHWD